jgi:hypothetical protein
LIPLLCLVTIAGCGGRLTEERRQRPPLREVFPPPSIETAQPAATPAPPAAGSAPAPAAEAAAPAAAASAAAAAATTPGSAAATPAPRTDGATAPASSAEPTAALKPPRGAEAAAALEPPSLNADAEKPGGAADPLATDTNGDLAREFEPATTQRPAAEGRSEPPVPVDEPAPSGAKTAAQPAAEAPRIVVSTVPAVLVSIQGEPDYGPVDGTKLQRVLNTPAFLVKGVSGNYYLSVYDGFMRAGKLSGPWSVMPETPRVVQEAKARALGDGEADVLAGRPDPKTGQRPTLKQVPPRIIISTQPAALVLIQGEPIYEPVEGTRLSRVVNTDARILVHRPEDRTYLRVGERWYRAASLKGPWEPVDGSDLPEGLGSSE